MSTEQLKQPALTVKNISMSFGGIKALQNLSFNINKGEVVALLGDNGAGKSTLVRCVSGIHQPETGEIFVNGKAVEIKSPQVARELGVETVFQDLALIPDFDIPTNLFLNREIYSKNKILKFFGWLDDKAMKETSKRSLHRLNSKVPDLERMVSDLSGGQRQAVAIARAVDSGADVVIMDEPTAALGVEQSAQVNELIRLISSQGVAVLLISHNMQHVMETCDRAVVLLRGEGIADVNINDVTPRDLVGFITGAQRLTA